MNAAAGSTPLARRMWVRVAASVSTARLRPGITGDLSVRRVLDLDVPQITLPVMPGRNLAVLAEAAARTHILRAKGVDPAAAFMARHSHFLERSS